MKKILTIICGLLLIGATANAQSGLLSFGVKGGIGASKFNLEGAPSGWQTEGTASWHAGLMLRVNIPVLPIYVQGEALYSRVGGSISANGITQDTYVNRMDIPVVAGFKFGLLGINARAYGGVVGQVNLSDNFKDAAAQLDPTAPQISSNDFVWGYQAGLGVDIKKLTIDVKYEGSSDYLSEKANVTSMKSAQWIASVGFFFGGND
ncbi:outer membrane beta-barrel protein [Flammeovirga pacifica]|uniref:Outer membrane protein beta-barrel domain-containing protein n=1 Tax=Flammeovirga pacifica TaxID=915059 RepID=A0A1S1Z4X8_FLAPC|nr:outer membrane beta-barrel protein [Flammeovirga pacifica]OHX68135.1 hypothetical protein NH26_18185 [Flammeovirga pacifica]